jgi:hypothetical protein
MDDSVVDQSAGSSLPAVVQSEPTSQIIPSRGVMKEFVIDLRTDEEKRHDELRDSEPKRSRGRPPKSRALTFKATIPEFDHGYVNCVFKELIGSLPLTRRIAFVHGMLVLQRERGCLDKADEPVLEYYGELCRTLGLARTGEK